MPGKQKRSPKGGRPGRPVSGPGGIAAAGAGGKGAPAAKRVKVEDGDGGGGGGGGGGSSAPSPRDAAARGRTEAAALGDALRACDHAVALPTPFDRAAHDAEPCRADATRSGTLEEPRHAGPRAKEYPFALDPFQETAVACLERRESVLVGAHTSAGKTVVAEYAIAMARRDGQRVVYTSPLKALSNQKYRDLKEEFGDVGLLTGDVVIAPNASCLVMTTEIMRSMLYRGSEVMRSVGWVIFDEVHYMRDRERGVVWEESLIFIPEGARVVLLSATLPNSLEFAEWVAQLHSRPVHVVTTSYRPTPLQHYVFPAGGKGLYLAVDERGRFRKDNYRKMRAIFKPNDDGTVDADDAMDHGLAAGAGAGAAGQTAGAGGGGRDDRGRVSAGGGAKGKGKKKASAAAAAAGADNLLQVCRVVKLIQSQQWEPCIVFSFKRRETEALALKLVQEGVDFNTDAEKAEVAEIYAGAVAGLSEEDREIPAVKHLLPILQKGVAVHHGGLLPLLKEAIELLFQEGYIKCLFATETFSMGLNMPARTVVFSEVHKWDGEENRLLNSGEYIQMSGRAGRRGKDARGNCIIMLADDVEEDMLEKMIKGDAIPLMSSFKLSYYTLLNLMSRVEAVADTEFVIKRSFHQFQHDRDAPRVSARLAEVDDELGAIVVENEAQIEACRELRARADREGLRLSALAMRPEHSLRFLQAGRLVRVRLPGMPPLQGAWCVAVRAVSAGENRYVVDCLMPVSSANKRRAVDGGGAAAAADGGRGADDDAPRRASPCHATDAGAELVVAPVRLALVTSLGAPRVLVPPDLRPRDKRASVMLSLLEILRRYPEGVPELDPIEHMGVDAKEVESIAVEIEALEAQMATMPEDARRAAGILDVAAGAGGGGASGGGGGNTGEAKKAIGASSEAPSAYERREALRTEAAALRAKQNKSHLSQFHRELRLRSAVLRRMGHVDGEGLVTRKGHAAREIDTADELLVSELMFSGIFSGMSAAQCAAVASCFVPVEKSQTQVTLKHPRLVAALQAVQDTAERIATVCVEEGLEMDKEEYAQSFAPTLMDVVYSWAVGKTFVECLAKTDLFEGSVIRAIRRLHELLANLCLAAKAVGDPELDALFEAAGDALRRGIVFSNSLYIDEEGIANAEGGGAAAGGNDGGGGVAPGGGLQGGIQAATQGEEDDDDDDDDDDYQGGASPIRMI